VRAPVQSGLTIWAIPSLTSGDGTSTTFNHLRWLHSSPLS
jgi:hypothetical protein